MSTRILARLIFFFFKILSASKMLLFQELRCVNLLPWFGDFYFDCSVKTYWFFFFKTDCRHRKWIALRYYLDFVTAILTAPSASNVCYVTCSHGTDTRELKMETRADKGWAVKRARPSKKVWCSGLGLYLEMSLVFDFGQGLRCGLYIRHCRCHWIMPAWFVFLHFFLFPLCWYAVSERQMLLFLREV